MIIKIIELDDDNSIQNYSFSNNYKILLSLSVEAN